MQWQGSNYRRIEMPKQYEAIRDALVKKGMPLKQAKSHAARIYNSQHPNNPVTRKEHGKKGGKKK